MRLKVRLLRDGPGLGDLIRVTAVARALKEQYNADVTLYADERYYKHAKYCEGPETVKPVTCTRKANEPHEYPPMHYDHTIDLFCPAFEWERWNAPDITKDRVELWTEACEKQAGIKLKPVAPKAEIDRDARRAGMGHCFRARLKPKGEREQPVILFNQFSMSPLRRFALKQIQDTSKELIEAGCKVGAIPLGLTIPQLWGMIYQSDGLITADSGPLHIAGVLGIPCVAVMTTAEGGLLTKWYDSVSYINPDYPCPGPCYYSAYPVERGECMEKQKCRAMESVPGKAISLAMLGALDEAQKGGQDASLGTLEDQRP